MTQSGHSEATAGLSCPMCGGHQASAVLRSRNGYDLLRCARCSLVFTDDRAAPPPAQLYPQFDQTSAGLAKSASSALQLFLRQREAFIRQLQPTGRLLDFGCGNGAFAQHMSRAGFEAVGIEPFSLGTTVTDARLTLIRAPFETVAAELGQFDVITLWHVLEHLRGPADVLRKLARHLAPGGVMVVSVPNFDSLQRAVFGGGWFHLDPPRHLIHFEPATLAACLAQAGLVKVEEKPFLPEYGSSGWVQSALNTVLPHTNYLYELVKDRGALRGLSRTSSALHLAGSLSLAAPLFPLSLPLEAIASGRGKGAALTVAARLAP